MSLNFKNMKTADMRLVILRSIADDGYSLNESLLQSVLGMYGHTATRDQVRTQMRWLEEQGLVAIEDVSGILVARLTGRGADVASGAACVDGVKRPRPKD
jgi:DNA-binding GntR family transcriptional regulator